MSWRTVIISNQSKLDYKMDFMVVRGETTRRVSLEEMAILVIENPAVSLTGCLVEALIEKKVKGIVQTLLVTEKQFSKMEFVVGEWKNDIINNDERLIVL